MPSYGNVSAWGSSKISITDFVFHPAGNGWQLDRKRFEQRLANAAIEAGATIDYGARFVGAKEISKGWKVRGLCADFVANVTARWLVDASGRNAIVARRLGAQRPAEDSLIGVWCIGELVSSPSTELDTRTLVESTPEGWWYFGALPKSRCVVAWLCDADELRESTRRSVEWFRERIDSTVHVRKQVDRLGYRPIDGPRYSDACSARTLPYAGTAWLAVGDAACSFDPLSSQGILHALETGIDAGNAIAEALRENTAPLRQYCATLEEKWAAYENARRGYYEQESRWIDSTFWRRRAGKQLAMIPETISS